MFEDEKTKCKYFLLFVDVYSSKLFAQALQTREAPEVVSALKVIIKNFNATIYEIQFDREKAFISKSMKEFLLSKNILFRLKYGKNKGEGDSFLL